MFKKILVDSLKTSLVAFSALLAIALIVGGFTLIFKLLSLLGAVVVLVCILSAFTVGITTLMHTEFIDYVQYKVWYDNSFSLSEVRLAMTGTKSRFLYSAGNIAAPVLVFWLPLLVAMYMLAIFIAQAMLLHGLLAALLGLVFIPLLYFISEAISKSLKAKLEAKIIKECERND